MSSVNHTPNALEKPVELVGVDVDDLPNVLNSFLIPDLASMTTLTMLEH